MICAVAMDRQNLNVLHLFIGANRETIKLQIAHSFNRDPNEFVVEEKLFGYWRIAQRWPQELAHLITAEKTFRRGGKFKPNITAILLGSFAADGSILETADKKVEVP